MTVDVTSFSGLFRNLVLTSDVFDLRGSNGTIGPNKCDSNYRNKLIEKKS